MNLKNISDYHTHNSRCNHAEGNLEDYIKAAIDIGLAEIGFCDHFPYEFLRDLGEIPIGDYAMPLEEIPNYLKEAEALRDKYKNQISVKIGFEVDFMIDQEVILIEKIKEYKDHLDFIFGSVHILSGENGKWCFDDNRFLKEYSDFGVDNVYLQYYTKLENMINSKKFDFDVVSHLDLPKKFNNFPENREIISDKVNKLLDLIKKRDLVVEINTGGYRKDVEEQYPSWDILSKIYSLDIPIVLGSDAHQPSEVAYNFKGCLTELKKIGFSQLVRFSKRKKEYIDF